MSTAPTDGATLPPTELGKPTRRRLIAVNTLIGVTTVLLVVGIFAAWANRLLFNPENWSNTSTQLLQSSNVRKTTADYLVDQIYANVNVAALLRSGLPPRLQPLAGPAAGALQNAAEQGIQAALDRPRVQDLWGDANRAAAQAFVAVVTGGNGKVQVKQGVVSLNLTAILDEIASRLGLPGSLVAKIPPNAANVTVIKSNQLKLIQNAGDAIRHLALWLTILVPLLYVLAIFLARGRRRRALMMVGLAGVVAGVLVIVGRQILITQVTNSLTHDASLRPTIDDVVSITTQMVHGIAAASIYLGILLIAVGWFAGPARAARSSRRAIAPFLREHPSESFAIVLAIMLLIFIWDPIYATGTPAGMIVFTVLALAGTQLLMRQTAREYPDARVGDATRSIRAYIEARQQRRRQQQPASAASVADPTAITDQLQQLADLRDHGSLTPEEYRTAKARLLHT